MPGDSNYQSTRTRTSAVQVQHDPSHLHKNTKTPSSEMLVLKAQMTERNRT